MRSVSGPFTLCFCALFLLLPTDSGSQPIYYKGKTITIVEGRSPGGVGDLRIKAIVPFLQKYIPGNPTIIPEYMPGAGGRKAANYVYRAKGDGLTIGASSPGVLASAVLGEPGVDYDITKFFYLGSPFSENNNIFVTRKALGLNSVEKLRAASGLRIGGQSVGHVQYIRSRLFAWLLDLKDPKFVVGYSGRELDAALERAEIDGRAAAIDNVTMTEGYRNLVDFHTILEIPKGYRPREFNALPEIEAFVRSQIESQVLAMSRVFWGAGTLIYLPPATPENLVGVLRQAFRRSFEDRQFYEQYKKLVGSAPSPLMPEDQQRLVSELPRDPEIAKVFKIISGMGPLPAR
jgi:tripartite-type tricarboxylate transporter receptor subunit TctC